MNKDFVMADSFCPNGITANTQTATTLYRRILYNYSVEVNYRMFCPLSYFNYCLINVLQQQNNNTNSTVIIVVTNIIL